MNTFFIPFLTAATLQFLALVAPGPDFALVTRNAILYTRKIAIYTSLGIALGLSVHISYCITALSLVAKHAHWIFIIFKYLGGAYLIYIGIQSWLDSKKKFSADSSKQTRIVPSNLQAIRQGFLCNLLNPKAALFFLGLFTLVVKQETPMWQKWVYCIWMMSITFVWFATLSYFITKPKMRTLLSRIQPVIVKILGVLLILMGAGLLFSGILS